MLREIRELWNATLNLTRARKRLERDPCPPHDYGPGYEFCVKCGKYR